MTGSPRSAVPTCSLDLRGHQISRSARHRRDNCVCSMAYGGHGLGPVRLQIIDINFVRALEGHIPFRSELLPILISVLESSRLHQSINFLRRPHPFQRDALHFRPAVLHNEFRRMVPDPRDLAAVRLGAVLAFYPPVGDRDPIPPSGVAALDLAGAARTEEGVGGRDQRGDQ